MGYYDDGDSIHCKSKKQTKQKKFIIKFFWNLECHDTCIKCEEEFCDICKYNLDPIEGTEFECDCLPEFSASIPGVVSNFCTTCNYAVIHTYFSDDLTHIYVEFPVDITVNTSIYRGKI